MTSIDTTNKFSFKAVGNLWRRRLKLLTVERDVVNYVQNITSNGTVNSLANEPNLSVQGRSSTTDLANSQSALSLQNSPSTSNLKNITLNNLSVYSSFNCFADFPSSIADYINDTFKNQFKLGHVDMYETDTKSDIQKLPVLLDVRATCSFSNDCKTYFDFDKQYGVETNYEGTMTVDNMFYCCPFHLTNKTSEVCKQAKPLVKKSILRQSTYPTLLVS